jgi:hypothetical protein
VRVASSAALTDQAKRRYDLEDGSTAETRHFFGGAEADPEGPDAFLVEFRPAADGVIRPHFHKVPQFQVVVGGDGRIGKRHAPPITFHFTDAWKPYGPIVPADPERGIDFITLRQNGRHKGSWYMPESRAELERRGPRDIAVEVPEAPLLESETELEVMIPCHEDGLAAFLGRLGPGERLEPPRPQASAGQYLLVVRGSLAAAGQELPPLSVLFAESDEPVVLTAGPLGADVLVLQFPGDTTEGAGADS